MQKRLFSRACNSTQSWQLCNCVFRATGPTYFAHPVLVRLRTEALTEYFGIQNQGLERAIAWARRAIGLNDDFIHHIEASLALRRTSTSDDRGRDSRAIAMGAPHGSALAG
jgi:hypothetical protein